MVRRRRAATAKPGVRCASGRFILPTFHLAGLRSDGIGCGRADGVAAATGQTSQAPAGTPPGVTRACATGVDCLTRRMTPAVQDHALDLPLGIDGVASPAPLAEVQEAVLLLFDAHRDGVQRYVHALGVTGGDGEDVVQDVFLALFHHVARGRARTNLRGWIFRVAHNLALKHRAREVRRRRLRTFFGPRSVLDSTPTPEDRYVSRQRRTRLLAVMNALPARERRCVQLRAEGLSYRENRPRARDVARNRRQRDGRRARAAAPRRREVAPCGARPDIRPTASC